MDANSTDLIKTPEACVVLAIGRTTLYQLAALGKIKRRYVSKGAVRWSKKELERYIEQSIRRRA